MSDKVIGRIEPKDDEYYQRWRAEHGAEAKANPKWVENDRLFFDELRQGWDWEPVVGQRFRDNGFTVVESKHEVRKKQGKFHDEVDLLVDGVRIEVKSRRLHFLSAEDYPYPTVFVMTKYAWLKKSPKPAAIVVVSRETRGMVVVGTAKRDLWVEGEKYDRIRKETFTFLACPLNLTITFDQLVDWLHHRRERS